MRAVQKRRRARDFGRLAEFIACTWLRAKGYRVLVRDLRTPVGEIDIIARRGKTVAFIEVKGRVRGDAALSLSPAQRRRIVRAASWFLQRRPELQAMTYRFDAVLIGSGWWPRHLQNAWSADEKGGSGH